MVSPAIFPASLDIALTDLAHAEDVIQMVSNEEIVDQNKEILEILEKNTNINMSTNIKNNKGTVKFWTKE